MNEEMDNLKQEILSQYPRLSEKDLFTFRCHKDVPCFNDCCSDVNIFLTPYDIIRLKNHLGISSKEFLRKYTLSPFSQKQKYPVILLKMTDEEKKCPFNSEAGCGVYTDRPWSCRMYPLGMASPKDDAPGEEEFYFLMKEDVCKGFAEQGEQSVGGWIEDQGIREYDEIGRLYKEITLHDFFVKGGELSPEKMEMFHLVCYDVDNFRRFIFDSTFFTKFEITDDLKEKLKTDDLELFKFGCDWIKFSIYGEKTMTINEEAKKAKVTEVENRSTPRG